jgi:hypothetical protein
MSFRVFLGLLAALALVSIRLAQPAVGSEFDEFGIKAVDAGESTSLARAHPDFTTKIVLNHHLEEGRPVSSARVQDISVSLPPGLIGNPAAFPTCSMGEFNAMGNCPIDSQVGVVKALVSELGTGGELTEPLYNLEVPHPRSGVAKFGFFAVLFPITIDVSVRTAGDYGVTATVHNSTGLAPLISATTTLWGVPAHPSHDPQRLTTFEAIGCESGTACQAPGGKRSSNLPELPFLTNPSACQEMEASFTATSYQLPGQVFSATAPMEPITDCESVPFDPTFDVQPTNRVAGAPIGLTTTLQIPQNEDPEGIASSAMRSAKVILPEGMTINAAAADGLAACSDQQVRLGEEVVAECPNASKLGEATIVSPSLPDAIHGAIYQRTPTPGHQFGLWLATDEYGLHIKLPGEVRGNPQTGQLTAEFKDLPQLPVEEIELSFWDGPKAALKNPNTCGAHATRFELAPWSGNPPAVGESQMMIDQGCGGGFSPKLSAGTTTPAAGAFSPFLVNLTRSDAEENVAGFDLDLPEGLLAKLAGVPLCPEGAAPTGACPDESKIGSVAVAAGAGPSPLWIPQPGKAPSAVYLAGPYKGAPYSVVTKVPAQAGPFDLGTVAVRSGIYVNSETGQASIKTDPLPQVLEGAAVLYRTIHVAINRPGFVLNPTDCREMAIKSTVTSAKGQVAHPADRFQVDGCRALKFKPKLSLKLKGGTKRGDYPALTAVMSARKGDANLRRASVALPHSVFLAQEHIETICTRVRFAADDCPKRAIYGYAKAWTPLLDQPIEGPVYLRSSNNPLPDLVAAMDGQIDIDLVGRIDSKNEGLRTTFESVPDAPVTRFVLRMKGGARGLLVNSENICRGSHRAVVRIGAQNGRVHNFTTPLRAKCGQSRR